MKQVLLIGVFTLCNMVAASADSYTSTRNRDLVTFQSDYRVASAACDKKYGGQNNSSTPPYRKCMLPFGFKWNASSPGDNSYDPTFGVNGISQ
jgi:hypothetical protein